MTLTQYVAKCVFVEERVIVFCLIEKIHISYSVNNYIHISFNLFVLLSKIQTQTNFNSVHGNNAVIIQL